MRRFVPAAFVALVGLLACWSGSARAQNTFPYQTPRFGPGYQTPLSPYLNLLIPGNSAINYYGLVQPEFQRRQTANVFQGQIQGLVNRLPAPPGITERDIDTPLMSTGHPTVFNYTGSYFGNPAVPLIRSQTNPFPRPGGQRPGAPGMRPGGYGMPGGGGGGIWPNNAPGGAFGQPPRR